MKRLLIVALVGVLAACHLSHPLTREQVVVMILDAGYGVELGCTAGWLDVAVCERAERVLLDARAAAESVSAGWQAAAKAVLVRERGQLDPDSRLFPYFDAVISLL